jgi:hypothetical protein
MPPGTESSSATKEMIVGENHVGTNHARDVSLESTESGKLDQLFGFARVEILGDPGRQLAIDAVAVHHVAGAIERQEVRPERFESGDDIRREWEGFRGDAPGHARKQALPGQLVADVPGALRRCGVGGHSRTWPSPTTTNL